MVLLLTSFGPTLHAAEFANGGGSDGYGRYSTAYDSVDEDAADADSFDQLTMPMSSDPIRSYVPRKKARPARPERGERPRSRVRGQISNACARFITPSGTVGDLGEIVERQIMRSPYKKQFLSGSGIELYCPRYKTFGSDAQRLKAWVALWGAIASEESACGTNQQTYAYWKAEYGLWQLEQSPTLRQYRSRACQNIGTVEREAACAISIMGDTQFRKGKPVYYKGSYWGPIRRSLSRSHPQVLPKMRRIDFCN